MQPTQRFKKTLLAGALLFGACNAFNASAETFTVSGTGIPDVDAAPVAGFTTLGFGATIKGGVIGGTCKILGASTFSDVDMHHDLDMNGADDTLAPAGAIFGSIEQGTTAGCATDTPGSASGAAMIIEISGITGSTVAISIPDVVGTGFTYTPSDESCYVQYDGTSAADLCTSLATGSATGVLLSANHATEVDGTATDYQTTDMVNKLRMILAGEITIDAPGIAQGSTVSEDIVVTVTYE
jgi:hypothetical protein